MPTFTRENVSLYYEEYGAGYPILLFAPGGMRSSIEFWSKSPFDPTREFASAFRVIAMDQRNAGKSSAPISAADGWETYTADHLALLDHLGIKRCHLMGGCIGSSYCLGLIKAAPERVSAAILQNPIGLSPHNREMFYAMFDGWADALNKERRPDAAGLRQFRDRMYGTDFIFNVSREFVRSCKTPMLILCGSDDYHPTETSREIATLAPNAKLIEKNWKTPDAIGATVKRVREFLASHTPKT